MSPVWPLYVNVTVLALKLSITSPLDINAINSMNVDGASGRSATELEYSLNAWRNSLTNAFFLFCDKYRCSISWVSRCMLPYVVFLCGSGAWKMSKLINPVLGSVADALRAELINRLASCTSYTVTHELKRILACV